MRNSSKILVGSVGIGILLFLLGPSVEAPIISKPLPRIELALEDILQWVEAKEATFPNIKPDNQSKVIFADSIPKQTEYAIVYLHGFSGSAEDGAPVHEQVAKAIGANLYLPRLYDHGLAIEEGLNQYTGEKSLDSAREALVIGKKLGKKVILMGTSTGCTLALTLASQNPEIAALVLYAPNIRIAHPMDFVATMPWGLQVVQFIQGSEYNIIDDKRPIKQQYWTGKYRLEDVVQMQKLLETTMNPSTFNQVTQPVFSGFYYKNENEQDPVVSVAAMREMFQALGTPENKKVEMAFPNAGAHEIACHIVTDNHHQVKEATLSFLQQIVF